MDGQLQEQPAVAVRRRARPRYAAHDRVAPAEHQLAASAPVGIAIVLDGENPMSEAYDEGRLTERLLTGATILGYGGGVAWFGEAEHQNATKRALGIPEAKTARQIVMIGKPKSKDDPRPYGPARGRRPLNEVAHYERWGNRRDHE